MLKQLRIVNSTLTTIQLKTWIRFPTFNMLKTLHTWSLNHRHRLCHGRKYTPVLELYWWITLQSNGDSRQRVAWRPTYKTVTTTRLQCMKSENISRVWSRRKAGRRTKTTYWRMETLLCVSQTSKSGFRSRSLWLACQLIRLLFSRNYTLSRLWHGVKITNALSNTGVETLSTTRDTWCGSWPTLRISFTPHSVALTAICHRNASIPKYTLQTGGGIHREREILQDDNVPMDV